MSAIEIIEQIKKLPQAEQQMVAEFIHAAEDAGALHKPRAAISEDFKRQANEMFTTNAELFRKLAQ
ncbi:MAG: hypothetical protein ACTHLW_17830 [Verrucomicrobiota bacterium]